MTIDKMINYCEEVAEKYKNKDGYLQEWEQCFDITYKEYAEEHRQIAEWLKELKEYRGMLDKVIDEIEEEIAVSEFEDYTTYDYRLGLEYATEIIEEYKKEIEQ